MSLSVTRRVLLAAALALLLPVAVAPQERPTPKLVVIVVVNQMRADYLSSPAQPWTSGFRTLTTAGAVFERAAYPYLNTVTCPGHATVGTGTFPRTHGMILNTWWHREERVSFDCTDDAASPDVTYGRPSKEGNSAKRLLVPTLADELRSQKPGARVVTLSLKARSAIGLAGHGGDVVTWFEDSVGSFVTSKAFAPEPVPALREFVARDPFEANQGRVWTLQDPERSYRARDAGVGETPPATWNGLFPHTVAGRAPLDATFFGRWQSSPFADAYLQRMAVAMIDSFALGQRDTTDFLGVSFSSLDLVGHAYGPDSREIEDMLRRLDRTIGALIEHLDSRVGRANYVLALTADHGVAPIAQSRGAGGRVATEDVREHIEETLTGLLGPIAKGRYVDAVNFTNVTIAPGVFERIAATPALWNAVVRSVIEIPGVARVLRADRLSDASADPYERAAALSHLRGRGGDLIVIPQPHWYFAARASGGTTHGTLHPYDQRVPLVLLGGAIRAVQVKTPATPADIAPTLAALAGVKLPRAEGHVLRGAFQ